MKKYFFIATLFGLIITCAGVAQTSNDIVIPLSDPGKRGKLKAHLNSGSITVKGTARKDVLLRYTMPAEDDKKGKEPKKEKEGDSRSGLKRIGGGGIDIEVTEHQNAVKVQSGSWNQRMNLEIEVPSGFDLQVQTYNNGFLMVSQVQGILELTNYNGKITALNVSGSVVAATYNGDIKITFDKVTDNTPMSFTTFNGDVDITLPSSYKSTIKARSEQGSIYSDFDVNFRSSGPIQQKEKKGDVYKVVIDEWKLGDINGGGAEIKLQTYNGDLIVRKK
jgi:DUF4097 and DUF4098 domain-containing protein YvlB